MGRIVGIDLGTTNCVVATVDMNGCRILHNRENETQTRSVVGFSKGEFLVGAPAVRRWPLAPKDTIISIKRLMGRAVSDPEVEKMKGKVLYEVVQPSDGTRDSVRVKLGGKEFSPVEISARILAKLKSDAEFVLGEEVTHAVITVPAYFSDKQKLATREAGLKAGLTVMKILDEPTAAAISFGIDSGQNEPKTVVVYDLGGGTFDISVLMLTAGSFAPLNLEGDMWLGGDNFDQVIVDYVVNRVRNEYGMDPTANSKFMATLKMEAQKAKEALTSSRITEIILPGLLIDGEGNMIDVEEEITREQFEDLCTGLVDRTVTLVKKAVENAGFTLNDIDYVLMAGNSSTIPKVQEAMENLFGGEKIIRKVHPKNCVAMGAAVAAAAYSAVNCPKCGRRNDLGAAQCEKCGAPLRGAVEKKACPTCGAENDPAAGRCSKCNGLMVKIEMVGGLAPFSYGIQTEGDRFNVFIDKNDQIPTPEEEIRSQPFRTRFPNQRMISIPVYGGDNMEKASRNEKQGEAFAVLPPGCPEGAGVRIKLWLNRDGAFEVSAQLEEGRDLRPWILRGDIDQKAVEILQKAEEKFHQKAAALSPEEKREAEKKRNEVLDDLRRVREMKEEEREEAFGGVERKAQEFQRFIDRAGGTGDPLRNKAAGLAGFTSFLINNYNWLIDRDTVYNLNLLAGKLQEALRAGDSRQIEELAARLDEETDRLLQTKKASGEIQPTVLGQLVRLRGLIGSQIRAADPALADELNRELDEIEAAMKRMESNVPERIHHFVEKLAKAIKSQKPGENMVSCPVCPAKVPFGTRKCPECGSPIDLVQGVGSSTGKELF